MRQAVALIFTMAIALPASGGPNVVVTAFPKGIVQTVGGPGAVDSFTIANVGDANATLSFQQNGSFFTISAATLGLAPGATQSIAINGLTQSTQRISVGSVTIAGSGVPPTGINVPVRLMAVPVPVATPNLVCGICVPGGTGNATSFGELIKYGPGSGQYPGALPIFNNGNAALQGMAVGDTSWLIPQTGFVSIGPNQNGQVSFIVDRTQRPDAIAPMGGTSGNLSLQFLSGNAAAQSVSVSFVDVVSPTAAPGEPPPLIPSEIALFLPALSTRLPVVSDLFLSSRQGDLAVTALKMYYSQSITGSPSLLATIAQPPSSLPIWFPYIVQTVFNLQQQQVGSVQLRGSQTTNVSIAAIQAAAPGDGRVFSSPLPVLRSDRTIGSGETLLLTGVAKSNELSTTLYLQETSGVTTMVQTNFFDATGAASGTSRTDTLAGFRSLELPDVVPVGAASLRITDVSGGRLTACAVTSDNATSASWSLIDSERSSPAGTNVWVIPLLAPPSGPAQADVFVTNGSANPVAFTLDPFTVNPVSRHHAVRSAAVSMPITLAPLATSDTSITASSPPTLLRLAGPAGAISASARMILTTPTSVGSFGASFPVVPLANALQSSHSTRFTGVDDTQFGLRSSLILAEVGGGTTTVSVTLHYVFVAGQAVSSEAPSTKNYTLNPGQLIVISSLASDVIGSLRNSIGDLRNMQVDINVTGGAGSILPFLAATDNSSGNIMVRAE